MCDCQWFNALTPKRRFATFSLLDVSVCGKEGYHGRGKGFTEKIIKIPVNPSGE